MSPEEFSLIAARPEGWRHLLFALALKREIGEAAPLRQHWHDGLRNEPSGTFDTGAYLEMVERTTQEAMRLRESLNAAWTGAVEAAAAAPEPEAILDEARAVGEQYRALLAWKPAVLSTPVPKEMAGMREDFSRMCDGLVLHLEMVAHGHSGRVLAALIAAGSETAVMQLPKLDFGPAQRLLSRLGAASSPLPHRSCKLST